MTLYYPQGLYGPICDIQPTTDVESVVREITIQEPNIQLTTEGESTSTSITGITRISPKVCKTVKVTTLLGGGLGPICDVPSDGNDGGDGAYQLCPDEFEPPDPTYRPLGGFPPEFNLEAMTLDCKSRTIELPSPTGTKTVTYFYECRPGIGNYSGPEPGDYGLPVTKRKIKYLYEHSLVCGATDYYSSPGIYTQTIPQGITALTIVAFGAGGGAGGIDASISNNSGGSGSFMYTTVTLDPIISNKLEYVIGGGGFSGIGAHNRPENTRSGFNRGGKGGHPGPNGISGAGGAGGGATDIFLNNRLIMSISGGGGGGGNGCNSFPSVSGLPWGNWNNYTYNNNPSISSDALKVSRFSPLMAVPIFEPVIKHSLWSNWFKQYVVWFNEGEQTLPGTQLENRVNIEFPVSGTYTFEFQGDNQLALYISPWYDPGEGLYITDNLYNGSTQSIRNNNLNNQTIPVDSDGNLQPPSTLPANISGASNWTFVGFTTNFTTETPTSVTYTVSTPGRYVLRTFLENAFGDPSKTDWLLDPGGMAIVIKKPDGSILWTTRSAFGNTGQNRSGDGPGAGGGGGNEGRNGLSSDGLGLGGGSCGAGDSTAQGGSAGWNYVIDHPAISVEYFAQAPSGMVSGWPCPNRNLFQSGTSVNPTKVFFVEKNGEIYLDTTESPGRVEIDFKFDIHDSGAAGWAPWEIQIPGTTIWFKRKLNNAGTAPIFIEKVDKSYTIDGGKVYGPIKWYNADPGYIAPLKDEFTMVGLDRVSANQYKNQKNRNFNLLEVDFVVYIKGARTVGTNDDITSRKAYGGFGGGRPIRFSIVYNGIEYNLHNANGSFKTVSIPGMGTGVWEDFVSGRTFQYPYFWGVTTNDSPSSTVPELLDISDNFAKILLGSYEGSVNSPASQRTLLNRARSLQLNLQWTPIQNGSTWTTEVRIVGIQPWGFGAAFEVNDSLPGVMPPLKSHGTQPWFDIVYGNTSNWDTVSLYDNSTNQYRAATKSNTAFNFSIKVTDVGNWDEYIPTSGAPGFVGAQYLSADYEFEEEEL